MGSPKKSKRRRKGTKAGRGGEPRGGAASPRSASPPRPAPAPAPPSSAPPSSPPPPSSTPPSSPPPPSSAPPSSPARPASPLRSSPVQPASPLRSSSARPAAPLRSSPAEAIGEGTPIFDVHLDDIQGSLHTSLKGFKQYFATILKEDSVELPERKLVTHPRGGIVLRITPSASDMKEPVYALYRTKDLYLDSVMSKKIWYRFADHDKELKLPPEIHSEGVEILNIQSNYSALNCDPDSEDQINIGEDVFRTKYQVLLDLGVKRNTDVLAVKSALLLLVTAVSEALRFPGLEEWILDVLARKTNMHIPLKLTTLFHRWGTFSKILHGGRESFSANSVKDDSVKNKKDIKDQWSTYDKICSLMGIVNRLNLRKLEKTKNKRKNTEAAKAAMEVAEAEMNNAGIVDYKSRHWKSKKKKF